MFEEENSKSEHTKKSTTADDNNEQSKQDFEELSRISEKEDEEIDNSVIQKDSGGKHDKGKRLKNPKAAFKEEEIKSSNEKKSMEDLIDM